MNRPKCSNCRGAPSAAQRRGGRTPFRRSSGRAVISVAHLIMRKVILRVSAPHYGKTVFVTTLGGRPGSASRCVGVCRATQPTEREHAMKLTSVFVERTLSQFEAEAIPDNHPAVPQLRGLFGLSHVLPRRQRAQHRGTGRTLAGGSSGGAGHKPCQLGR